MKKIFKFFKKYWLLIILAFILGCLILIKLKTSKKTDESVFPATPSPKPQLSLIEKPEFSGVLLPDENVVNISNFSFPSFLDVFWGRESKINSKEAKSIAQKFGFNDEPQKINDLFSGEILIWSSEEKSLSVNLENAAVNYGLNYYLLQPAQNGSFPDFKEAQNVLTDYLKTFGLSPEYKLAWQKEKFLTLNGYFQETKNVSNADFFKIGFNPLLEEYQLIGFKPQEPLVSLTLEKKGQTANLEINVYFSNFETREKYELKNESEIKQSLKTEAKIVYSGTQEETIKEPNFVKTSFQEIKLAYLQETKKNLLIQPIFILSGKGTLDDGKTTEIIAYLPAIASKWFKNKQEHFETEEIPVNNFLF